MFFSRYRNRQPASGTKKNQNEPIDPSLDQLFSYIKQEFSESPDFVIRTFSAGNNNETRFGIIYLECLVDEKVIDEWVIKSLTLASGLLPKEFDDEALSFDMVKNRALSIGKIAILETKEKIIKSILSGNAVLVGAGWKKAISCSTASEKSRPISEPTAQSVIRGPLDSFTESIKVNLSLIRRRIRSPHLKVKSLDLGHFTHTKIFVLHIEGIANPKIVKDVLKRLKEIDIDSVLESGYIESFLEEKTFTPFPTVLTSGRPDDICGNLMDGRVAILVDNSPFALVVPSSFRHLFMASEDYYQRYDIASFLRLVRFVSFFVSLVLPSLYVALITHHPQMLPTSLLINLSAQRENVPIPTLFEAIIMELMFEVIREAGIRAPRVLSTAITIVGAIVLGQTAVSAGLVTPAMVIVVAITGLASFVNPSYELAITARLIRFVMMILAATFGLLGITLGLVVMISHMNSLSSFGVPYLEPFSPLNLKAWGDTFIRLPLWMIRKRPADLHPLKKNMIAKYRLRNGRPSKEEDGSG